MHRLLSTEAGILPRSPPREILQQALQRIDRAQLRAGRLDVAASLRAWQAWLDGHWSLAEHWDSDGHRHGQTDAAAVGDVLRFVLAVKNEPRHPDRRGLTLPERHCAELLGLGQSTKDIAYARYISAAAVSAQLTSARQKLGLCSRTELAAFFSPSGARTRLVEVAIEGETLLIGAYSLCKEHSLAQLTRAEHAVATLLLRGASNQSIAERRRTSPRTIANQVQAIFRKLRVQSRVELVTVLQAGS